MADVLLMYGYKIERWIWILSLLIPSMGDRTKAREPSLFYSLNIVKSIPKGISMN